MGFSNQFFSAIDVDKFDKKQLSAFTKKTGIKAKTLKFYNDNNVLPSGRDLETILSYSGISKLELMLKMGILDHTIIEQLQENATDIIKILKSDGAEKANSIPLNNVFESKLGKLYEADCLNVMKKIESDSVDLIFADPPFNLNKLYPSKMDDNVKVEKYLSWSEKWMDECVRILKPGGAFFTWNLPVWNSRLSNFLHQRLTFRHWIAVDIKYSLPIQSRLYPSHYSLMYFIKGEKPNTFKADRMAMQTCPKCFHEIKDYGGYKNKMNPKGINLTDVWLDIPPVRHSKYKTRDANELSIKLLDRIIEMSSNEGDLIFDPFGGAGTTYTVAELKNRKWIGCEIGPTKGIIERISNIDEEREYLSSYRSKYNALFPENIDKERVSRGIWTPETL